MGRFEAERAKAGSEPYAAGGSVTQGRGGIVELEGAAAGRRRAGRARRAVPACFGISKRYKRINLTAAHCCYTGSVRLTAQDRV